MTRFLAGLVWTSLIIGCWALGTGADKSQRTDTHRIDAHRHLGTPIQVENLTVWPVLTDAPVATSEMLSLHQAQQKGWHRCAKRVSRTTPIDAGVTMARRSTSW